MFCFLLIKVVALGVSYLIVTVTLCSLSSTALTQKLVSQYCLGCRVWVHNAALYTGSAQSCVHCLCNGGLGFMGNISHTGQDAGQVSTELLKGPHKESSQCSTKLRRGLKSHKGWCRTSQHRAHQKTSEKDAGLVNTWLSKKQKSHKWGWRTNDHGT